MPICPEDRAELVRVTAEPAAAYATFWECPAHGGRYVGWGLTGLVPVPKAAISNPPAGFYSSYNIYTSIDGRTFYFINAEGAQALPVPKRETVVCLVHPELEVLF